VHASAFVRVRIVLCASSNLPISISRHPHSRCLIGGGYLFVPNLQVVAYSSGSPDPHILSAIAFEKLLNRVLRGSGGAVCALQAHVQGTSYRVSFKRGTGPTKSSWRTVRVMDNGNEVVSRAGTVNATLAEAAARLIQHVEDVKVRAYDTT